MYNQCRTAHMVKVANFVCNSCYYVIVKVPLYAKTLGLIDSRGVPERRCNQTPKKQIFFDRYYGLITIVKEWIVFGPNYDY